MSIRYLRAICGLAVIALVLSGCGGGSGSSSAAAVSSSSGSAASGSGSGTSQASTGTATLDWQAPTTNTNGSALNDLAGYHIHYGTSASSMTHTIDVPSASATSYVISSLSAGTWYFGITAYTNTGLESALSNIGSKTIN